MTKKLSLKAILFSSFLFFGSMLYSQSSALPDTSYFKAGKDGKNLIEAVNKNDLAACQLLLDRGAEVDALSSTGNTPLMYAAEKRNLDIMKLLVAYGADVNFVGFNTETPLLLTIFHNDFQASKYLLENGANPNTKDRFTVTPLIYAAATNQYQTADLLLFYDASDSIRDSFGNDPLLAAVTFDNLETSDVLLQNELNPDRQDIEGNTPAIVASQHGNFEILKLLTEYNADINIANKKNYTPLAYAVIYEDIKSAELLISEGAYVDHKISEGKNIAELARMTHNDTLINLISQNGGLMLTKPDFSEFRFSWISNFNSNEYMTGLRGMLYDTKYGFYFETGIDFRPVIIRVRLMQNDELFQYREGRIAWSHGIGKEFTFYRAPKGNSLGAYAAVTGFMSFPSWAGTSLNPKMQYNIIPEGGLFYWGQYAGIKAGFSYMDFDNLLDKNLKASISLFFRIKHYEEHYDRKEIYWE